MQKRSTVGAKPHKRNSGSFNQPLGTPLAPNRYSAPTRTSASVRSSASSRTPDSSRAYAPSSTASRPSAPNRNSSPNRNSLPNRGSAPNLNDVPIAENPYVRSSSAIYSGGERAIFRKQTASHRNAIVLFIMVGICIVMAGILIGFSLGKGAALAEAGTAGNDPASIAEHVGQIDESEHAIAVE